MLFDTRASVPQCHGPVVGPGLFSYSTTLCHFTPTLAWVGGHLLLVSSCIVIRACFVVSYCKFQSHLGHRLLGHTHLSLAWLLLLLVISVVVFMEPQNGYAALIFKQLDVRSLAAVSRPRQSETEWRLANCSRIGAYRTCTSGNDFPCELCAQNCGNISRIIKMITIEQAYVVTTFQA